MALSMQSRKLELVRYTIFESAIRLFARQGFDETTIEEVAQAAGLSRGSFFRYFATKDDLLAYSVVNAGDVLVKAAAACPVGLSALELVRETALAGANFSMSQPLTRQIIEITARNFSARRAHKSRLVESESRLAEVFAARIENATGDDLEPRMLAILTLMVVDLTLSSWFKSGFKDGATVSERVFAQLSRVFCEPSGPSEFKGGQRSERRSAVPAPRGNK
jgi:AcrR family transcriptional regulator